MATSDNIQANVGPLLCFFFSIIIIPQLMFIYLYLVMHLHEHEIHFGISFFGFNPNLLTVFQI